MFTAGTVEARIHAMQEGKQKLADGTAFVQEQYDAMPSSILRAVSPSSIQGLRHGPVTEPAAVSHIRCTAAC